MNNSNIIDYLIDKLYSNNNYEENFFEELSNYIKQKKINVYGLYNILLELFLKSLKILKISIIFDSQIHLMQQYFNKIKIQIHLTFYSKEDITNNYNNLYSDRLYRGNKFLMETLILNSTHIYTNDLFNIRTFISPYSDLNFCIQFSYI